MSAKRILLINHDASIGEVLSVCLRYLAGWDVVTIGASQASFESAIQNDLDAILLDSTTAEKFFPKIHGLGFIQEVFIKQLKKNRKTQAVPILLISDKADWFTPEQLQSLGIEGAIAKPFDPVTLPTQIARLLSWDQVSTSTHSKLQDS